MVDLNQSNKVTDTGFLFPIYIIIILVSKVIMLYKSFSYRQRVNKWSIKVRTSNTTGFHIFIAFSRSWRALILNNGYNYGGMLLNAAFVDTTLHKNVSRASPRTSPWVASDPVRDSVEAAPADNDYTVIHTQVVTCHIIVHPIPMLDEKDVTLIAIALCCTGFSSIKNHSIYL